MKGHVPFAFLGIENPPNDLLKDLNKRLREHIGPIAALGGFISKPGIIPKTRSGKTLRRCLREILENGLNGEYEKEITVPATVEDASVVDKAKDAAKVSCSRGSHAVLSTLTADRNTSRRAMVLRSRQSCNRIYWIPFIAHVSRPSLYNSSRRNNTPWDNKVGMPFRCARLRRGESLLPFVT